MAKFSISKDLYQTLNRQQTDNKQATQGITQFFYMRNEGMIAKPLGYKTKLERNLEILEQERKTENILKKIMKL